MLGPVVSVAVLSLIGLAGTRLTLAAILVAGGLGAAAFHPPAAALAHRLGGERRGFAMSVYITGGTLGFALGPLVFAPFAQRFGIEWTPVLALPGLAVVAFFVRRVPPIPVHPSAHGAIASLRPYAKPLALLYTIVVLRTLASLTFATFVPVMLTRRGMTIGEAGASVALYLFGSGVGGFFGGPAADRFGARTVIALSLVIASPFLFIAPFLSGWHFVAMLAVGGLFLQSTLPVNVTFGQSLAPVSAATVSSLMMGFGWGTGGLSVPFVGMIADRVGIEPTLIGVSVIPLFAAACALWLPGRVHAVPAPQPAEVMVPETRP
jgi:FSR family fosmidomycin resistance protein-like MFS transporter